MFIIFNFPGYRNDTVVTASHAIFSHKSQPENKYPVAVVGFQFRHMSLHALFKNITSTVSCTSELSHNILKLDRSSKKCAYWIKDQRAASFISQTQCYRNSSTLFLHLHIIPRSINMSLSESIGRFRYCPSVCLKMKIFNHDICDQTRTERNRSKSKWTFYRTKPSPA
jgi:hypothetical protein